MNIQQQNLDDAYELITKAAIKIEELTTLPQYAEIAKGIKDKTPVSLADVLLALRNLAAVVNIQLSAIKT